MNRRELLAKSLVAFPALWLSKRLPAPKPRPTVEQVMRNMHVRDVSHLYRPTRLRILEYHSPDTGLTMRLRYGPSGAVLGFPENHSIFARGLYVVALEMVERPWKTSYVWNEQRVAL